MMKYLATVFLHVNKKDVSSRIIQRLTTDDKEYIVPILYLRNQDEQNSAARWATYRTQKDLPFAMTVDTFKEALVDARNNGLLEISDAAISDVENCPVISCVEELTTMYRHVLFDNPVVLHLCGTKKNGAEVDVVCETDEAFKKTLRMLNLNTAGVYLEATTYLKKTDLYGIAFQDAYYNGQQNYNSDVFPMYRSIAQDMTPMQYMDAVSKAHNLGDWLLVREINNVLRATEQVSKQKLYKALNGDTCGERFLMHCCEYHSGKLTFYALLQAVENDIVKSNICTRESYDHQFDQKEIRQWKTSVQQARMAVRKQN